MFLPEGLLGKEQRCSRVTLFALDNLSAQRKNITSTGDDSNKDGLKHRRTAAEVRVFALCLPTPPPPFFKDRIRAILTFTIKCNQHLCLDAAAETFSTGYIATRHTLNVTRTKLARQICGGNNDIVRKSQRKEIRGKKMEPCEDNPSKKKVHKHLGSVPVMSDNRNLAESLLENYETMTNIKIQRAAHFLDKLTAELLLNVGQRTPRGPSQDSRGVHSKLRNRLISL